MQSFYELATGRRRPSGPHASFRDAEQNPPLCDDPAAGTANGRAEDGSSEDDTVAEQDMTLVQPFGRPAEQANWGACRFAFDNGQPRVLSTDRAVMNPDSVTRPTTPSLEKPVICEPSDRNAAKQVNSRPIPPSAATSAPGATPFGLDKTLATGVARAADAEAALRSAATPQSIAADGQNRRPAAVTPLLAAQGLVKSYHKGRVAVPVLRGVDFQVYPEEFVSMVGQSGSGKSTLLHVLGTLDAPNAGEIFYQGQRIDNLPATKRDALRNQQFGMVFQFYHLLPELTVLENALMPVMIKDGVFRYWRNRRLYRQRACELLEMVGLSHRLRHQPRELSGGEMQRTAIARALISQPRLLLADEPTGNLDRQNGEEVLRILRTLNREQKLTIVMVTHDTAIAEQADRTVRLAEGQVQVS